MSDPIEAEIFDQLARREPGKSICPSEVAKVISPERWQREMGKVRAVATGLARQGRLVITKKGKPVDPEAFKGVIRLKLPETGAE
ncbi:MAG: DUF3253 domain-containing protein [Alphaproteobacteria bacterium]|nr:DUF3253 domain-containing protein [Alphaproteobacteria bacterium]MBU1526130.1 DUF3253 domain-containing protein [Alphaproteobacteria bacterium]MBU2116595.1 DUF3253 domain-containing protein [Alphaproteobacteria bacterium]MBU2350233.1 DUF3253 domain-containing protein [Alphaproteobacteria bacterium]MBU2381397.1 DUF3253 domain-containing protein [Alphaproteobacteria bacterium]